MEFRVIRLERTASTMKDAAAHPPGTVIVAEEQTAGQGRLGRRWLSERGAGLYFSVSLPLPRAGESLSLFPLAFGLATQEAIQKVAGAPADLRWPNDVLIGEKKCAGILVELESKALIAGIGVNVNQTRFPDDIAAVATSLRIATGRPHSKDDLLDRILEGIDSYSSLLSSDGPDAILRLFSRASSYVSGRRVTVDGIEGTTDGLDPSGFLWLRQDNGKRRLIVAGGVRPVAKR